MTVTRMATPRGPIPVTVDTVEASGGKGRGGGYHGEGVGTRSADAYKGMWGLGFRAHVPNNEVLRIWLIVILVQALGKYLFIRYLDP